MLATTTRRTLSSSHSGVQQDRQSTHHPAEPAQRPSHCHTDRGLVALASTKVRAMLGVVGTLPRRHRQAIARVSVSALVASLPLLYVSLLRPPPAALAGDTAFWFLMSNCVIAAIVATADDAGALFFGSSNDDDDPPRDDDRHDGHVSSPVPFAAVNDEAAVVVTTMKGRSVQEEVVADSNPVDLLDLQPNHHMLVSALVRQRGERHEAALERNTDDKNNTAVMMVVEGQGEVEVEVEVEGGEIASPVLQASDDRVLAEPSETETEPWAPKLVTSKSLPDQEEAANQEWPRAPDVLPHGKGGGGRLRRSATDASKSAAEERESDYYWQLSDEELNRRVEDFIARFNRQMRLQIEQEAAI